MTAVPHEASRAVRETAGHFKDQAAAIGGKAGRRLRRVVPGSKRAEIDRPGRGVGDHAARVAAAIALPVAALATAMRVRRAKK